MPVSPPGSSQSRGKERPTGKYECAVRSGLGVGGTASTPIDSACHRKPLGRMMPEELSLEPELNVECKLGEEGSWGKEIRAWQEKVIERTEDEQPVLWRHPHSSMSDMR